MVRPLVSIQAHAEPGNPTTDLNAQKPKPKAKKQPRPGIVNMPAARRNNRTGGGAGKAAKRPRAGRHTYARHLHNRGLGLPTHTSEVTVSIRDVAVNHPGALVTPPGGRVVDTTRDIFLLLSGDDTTNIGSIFYWCTDNSWQADSLTGYNQLSSAITNDPTMLGRVVMRQHTLRYTGNALHTQGDVAVVTLLNVDRNTMFPAGADPNHYTTTQNYFSVLANSAGAMPATAIDKYRTRDLVITPACANPVQNRILKQLRITGTTAADTPSQSWMDVIVRISAGTASVGTVYTPQDLAAMFAMTSRMVMEFAPTVGGNLHPFAKLSPATSPQAVANHESVMSRVEDTVTSLAHTLSTGVQVAEHLAGLGR